MSQPNSTAFDLDRIGGRRALSDLISEVLAAGEEALQQFRAGAARNYLTKPDHSPVTAADRLVESRLRGFIERRFPPIGFLGEESGQTDKTPSGMRFIVDPIDGTRAFIRGLSGWAVLVGLEAQDEPVLGIAFMPASDLLYVAVKGEGAQANGRPLRVSAIDSVDTALISHGGLQQFTNAGVEHLLPEIARCSYSQRGFADFGGYGTVLEGKADAMVDPDVKPWDLCAPAILIREAGGAFTSFEGEHTIYGGSALASNGLIHGQLLEMIRKANRETP